MDPKAAKERYEAWITQWQPSNCIEREFLTMAVSWSERIGQVRRSQKARIDDRITNAPFERARQQEEEVIMLSERLFWHGLKLNKSRQRADALPITPALIVQRLKRTPAGCQWLLDRWAALKANLIQYRCWTSCDNRKLVRLLGCEPLEVLTDARVAQAFLAHHVFNGEKGSPYQDIIDELDYDERIWFERGLAGAEWESLRPKDAIEARNLLLLIATRGIERLELAREQAQARDLRETQADAERIAADATPEGERMRRYELECYKAMTRAIKQVLKLRRIECKRKKAGLDPLI
jgi:hypothetical protein